MFKDDSSAEVPAVDAGTVDEGPDAVEEYVARLLDEAVEAAYPDSRAASADLSSFSLRRNRWNADRFMSWS